MSTPQSQYIRHISVKEAAHSSPTSSIASFQSDISTQSYDASGVFQSLFHNKSGESLLEREAFRRYSRDSRKVRLSYIKETEDGQDNENNNKKTIYSRLVSLIKKKQPTNNGCGLLPKGISPNSNLQNRFRNRRGMFSAAASDASSCDSRLTFSSLDSRNSRDSGRSSGSSVFQGLSRKSKDHIILEMPSNDKF